MRFWGHKGSASWEECQTEMFEGKCTQKVWQRWKKKCGGIQTDLIGRQWFDELGIWHSCNGWARGCKTGWKLFWLRSGF